MRRRHDDEGSETDEPETAETESAEGGHGHRDRVRVRPVGHAHGRDRRGHVRQRWREVPRHGLGAARRGRQLEEAIKAEGEKGTATLVAETEAAPGESTTVEVEEDVGPGPYVMLCPIEDEDGAHYELGQLEEFEVE